MQTVARASAHNVNAIIIPQAALNPSTSISFRPNTLDMDVMIPNESKIEATEATAKVPPNRMEKKEVTV